MTPFQPRISRSENIFFKRVCLGLEMFEVLDRKILWNPEISYINIQLRNERYLKKVEVRIPKVTRAQTPVRVEKLKF